MLTVVTELPEYIRRSAALLSEAERKAVIDHLAQFPRCGDVMEVQAASASCVGAAPTKAKAVACG